MRLELDQGSSPVSSVSTMYTPDSNLHELDPRTAPQRKAAPPEAITTSDESTLASGVTGITSGCTVDSRRLQELDVHDSLEELCPPNFRSMSLEEKKKYLARICQIESIELEELFYPRVAQMRSPPASMQRPEVWPSVTPRPVVHYGPMDPLEEAAVAGVVQRAVARIPENSDAVVKDVSGTTKQPAEFRKPPLGCFHEEHYKEIEEPKDVGGGPFIYTASQNTSPVSNLTTNTLTEEVSGMGVWLYLQCWHVITNVFFFLSFLLLQEHHSKNQRECLVPLPLPKTVFHPGKPKLTIVYATMTTLLVWEFMVKVKTSVSSIRNTL